MAVIRVMADITVEVLGILEDMGGLFQEEDKSNGSQTINLRAISLYIIYLN
jgi:hypothetical protein